MGHQRLGRIPKSKSFQQVVALISGFAGVVGGTGGGAGISIFDDVEAIAASTLAAAQSGLTEARSDSGLCDTFYLLTQLVLAARDETNWRQRFSELGISLDDNDGMFESASELQYAIQDRFDEKKAYSDVAEMARKAAANVAGNGFNLDIKNPHSTDDGPGDPDELLQEFARVDAEAARVLEALKQELAEALGGSQ
ncbi:MAG: hypothetical protein KDA89_01735 [Planctomycetaceae bacterium]|nr:hypothetical protein [Planctomycetaceae bacterium]